MTLAPSPALPVPEVIFEGPASMEFRNTRALFIGGATVVDLFFRLVTLGEIRVTLPVVFDWAAQLNPTGAEEDWYLETVEAADGDGQVNHKPSFRHLQGLETLLVPSGDWVALTYHVRLGCNARQMRLGFRGQLGSEKSTVKITALRGR